MKYSKAIVEKLCKHLKKGSSIKSACAAVGIAESTFYEWRDTKSEFSESVRQAMAIPDKKVENALYKTAKGFFYTETEYKAIETKDVPPKIKYIAVKKTRKMTLPNIAAQKFILINRNPDEWRDKTEHEHSGSVVIKVISAVPRPKKRKGNVKKNKTKN